MDKNDIERSYENPLDFDRQAEREGLALKKQGQYTQSKYQYIRQQTENYNTEKMRKLFRR